MSEDEKFGWHHPLYGCEFEQALGVGDGQGSLACCSPWVAESDTTEQLNLIEQSYWIVPTLISFCFPHSSVGKESGCNAGDPSSIPDLGRSAGEQIGCPLQYSWASLVAQLVKNLPAMQETWV